MKQLIRTLSLLLALCLVLGLAPVSALANVGDAEEYAVGGDSTEIMSQYQEGGLYPFQEIVHATDGSDKDKEIDDVSADRNGVSVYAENGSTAEAGVTKNVKVVNAKTGAQVVSLETGDGDSTAALTVGGYASVNEGRQNPDYVIALNVAAESQGAGNATATVEAGGYVNAEENRTVSKPDATTVIAIHADATASGDGDASASVQVDGNGLADVGDGDI